MFFRNIREELVGHGLIFLLILGFSLVSVLSFSSLSPAMQGYEISIYSQYSVYFWAIVIGVILIAQFSILKGRSDRNNFRFGFLLLLLLDAFLLSIPSIRGYAIYGRGDVLTHIGYVRSILMTGEISSYLPKPNIYPAIHVLASALVQVTGIDISTIVGLLPPIYSIFYLVAVYLLLREVVDDIRLIHLVVPMGGLLIFQNGHLIFAPSSMAFFLVPFVLYLLWKSIYRGARPFILLVVVLSSLVFYHPVIIIFLIAWFMLLKSSNLLGKLRGLDHGFDGVRGIRYKRIPNFAILISFSIFVMWYLSYRRVQKTLATTIIELFSSSGETQFAQYSEVVSRTSPALIDLAEIAFYRYGSMFALAALGSMSSIFIVFKWIKADIKGDKGKDVFSLAVALSFYFFLILSFFFAFLNPVSIGFGRVARFVLFASPICVGFALYYMPDFDSLYANKFIRAVYCFSLVFLVLSSTFSLYFSPKVKVPNQQVTEMEVEGAAWINGYTDVEKIDNFGINMGRMRNLFQRPLSGQIGNLPPDHFRYRKGTQPKPGSNYLVITKLGRRVYPSFYPDYKDFWKYGPSDFARIEIDSSINKVYSNGELTLYGIMSVS